jgi:hypothetical protein
MKRTEFLLVGKSEEKHKQEEPGKIGKIILEWILENRMRCYGLD